MTSVRTNAVAEALAGLLALVTDPATFKARLKELSEAEASAESALERANAKGAGLSEQADLVKSETLKLKMEQEVWDKKKAKEEAALTAARMVVKKTEEDAQIARDNAARLRESLWTSQKNLETENAALQVRISAVADKENAASSLLERAKGELAAAEAANAEAQARKERLQALAAQAAG